MLTNAVQAMLNLTDLWFIGRLSTDAVAAMGAIYWILTCAILLFGGVASTVQTFVAQAFGSRRKARASLALWSALWAIVGIIPLFLAMAFAGPWLLHSNRTSRPWHSSTGRRAWAARSSGRWSGLQWVSSTASPGCVTRW
jgi:Na+-driven multidrug efflux pump